MSEIFAESPRPRPQPHPALRWRPVWQLTGALLVLLVVYESLTSSPHVQAGWPGGDKFGHLFAYAILMAWYAQLYQSSRARMGVALALIALGGALEVLQPLLAPRFFEWWDWVADAAGVGLALVLCRERGGRLLAGFERRCLGRALL